MNSLHQISGHAQKVMIALIITGMLALAAAAQNVQPQRQGAMYGDPGFRGEPINLNVVNADVRDILNYITEQYGVNFVIDKSVKSVPVTVNVSEVPWNIALDSILRSQELGVQVNGTILRVADAKALATEGELYRAKMDNDLDSSPLYTEFIRLNYARAAGTIGRRGRTSTWRGATCRPRCRCHGPRRRRRSRSTGVAVRHHRRNRRPRRRRRAESPLLRRRRRSPVHFRG